MKTHQKRGAFCVCHSRTPCRVKPSRGRCMDCRLTLTLPAGGTKFMALLYLHDARMFRREGERELAVWSLGQAGSIRRRAARGIEVAR